MIYAEIKGKVSEVEDKEDFLTSNVFGLISLLPNFILIKVLNKAIDTNWNQLNLNENQKIDNFEFWKKFDWGEPDIYVEGETFVGIIEAKFRSGKSGSAFEDEETKETKNKDVDQLAKYWKCIHDSPKDKFIVYLTNDIFIPLDSIKLSEKASDGEARIFWLNWTTIHYELVNLGNDVNLNNTDRKIIDVLDDFCKYKGFTHFMGWADFDNPNVELGFYKES